MNILGILVLYGKLRPLLQGHHLYLDKGVTLLLEDEVDCALAEQAFDKLEGCGCKKLREIRKKMKLSLTSNNLTLVHNYRRLDSSKEIEDYLRSEEFFPMILTYGWVPEALQSNSYVIQINTKEITGMESISVAEEISGVVDFTAEHLDYVQVRLGMYCRSDSAKEERYCGCRLSIGMNAVLTIYKTFLLFQHSEKEAMVIFDSLQDMIEKMVSFSQEASEQTEVLDCVIRSVRSYVESEHVLVCSIRAVEGEVIDALEMDKAILYDDNHYFISEQLFRQMCMPLLKTVSLGEIKYRMAEAGVLINNKGSSTSTNFTVKRVFYTVFGEAKRKRFVKLLKGTFQEDNMLTLEEIGGQDVYRKNSRLICRNSN
ncbi:MAG: hypothetical protein LBT06_01205 [Hungatella sp.]|jgi:hypothetical protein|nr:hypothetical protein [Hungatella sp.]